MLKRLPFITFALLLLAAVTAGSAAAGSDTPVRHRTGESAAKVREFWTPARMARARDLGSFTGGSGNARLPGPVVGASTAAAPGLRHRQAKNLFPAIGRIFFRYGPYLGSCSGTAINTPSQRLVLTAGHCLKPAETWSRRVIFVPDYYRGRRPYGSWVWKTLWVTRSWANRENFSYDIGVIVTRRSRRGRRVGEVTDSLPYAAFPDRRGRTWIFGYPGGSNRAREKRACANRWTWPELWSGFPGPRRITTECSMARGSSGGPWVSDYGSGDWFVDGLTSTGNRAWTKIYSPYFGQQFRGLIHNAEHH